MDTSLIDKLETEESMFVQTAEGFVTEGDTLTLSGVTPSTLDFSDRPSSWWPHDDGRHAMSRSFRSDF